MASSSRARSRTPRPASPSRASQDYDPAPRETSAKGCRDHLATMFLTNKLSGPEVQNLARLAAQAGAQGLESLSKAGKHGLAYRNIARDIKRVTTRTSTVPPGYFVTIPITTASGQQALHEHPVLLPHEMLEYLLLTGTANLKDLVDLKSRVDQTLHERHRKFCLDYQLDPQKTIALGFHGDGPTKRRRANRPPRRYCPGICCATWTGNVSCSRTSTMSSCVPAGVVGDTRSMRSWVYGSGPCWPSWTATIPDNAMTKDPWMTSGFPGPGDPWVSTGS